MTALPLPPPGSPWPPAGHDTIHQQIRTWSAWWLGSVDELAAVYGGAGGFPMPFADKPSQHRGGVVGKLSRWFWGQPTPPGQRSTKLHMPIASEIADTAAHLLFAEPPDLTVEDQATQDRLAELFNERTWARLLTAAEISAALGGVFLRVGWDQDIAQQPLLSLLSPDMAVPEFRWQTLTAVTFAWTLTQDTSGTLRHLERHEPGRVLHGLYRGDRGDLGMMLPLTEHPSTADLAGEVDEDGAIPTGLPGLDVVYVPNQPNPAWRHNPLAADQGAADIAGIEPVLDAVDETATAWMRDVRLGKARIIVPQEYLTSHGPGQGASIDLDREAFTPVRSLGGEGLQLQPQQFAIRHEEHSATLLAYTERVVTGAGYSAQTFGLTTEVAMTATESHARERRTYNTRGAKTRRWALGLAELAEIMLMIDRDVFNTQVTPQRPTVEFPDIAPSNPEQTAQTLLSLRNADAASTRTLVETLHQEWTEEQVTEEVDRIDGGRMEDTDEMRGIAGQE